MKPTSKPPSKRRVIEELQKQIDHITWRMETGFDWNLLNAGQREIVVYKQVCLEKAVKLLRKVK